MHAIVDLARRLAPRAPIATVLFALGALAVDNGDIRDGLFPWMVAGAAASLALVPLGVGGAHDRRPAQIGGGLAAATFLGPAIGLAAIGIGGVLGIEEDAAGIMAWIPVIATAFGIIGMAPAVGFLAWTVRRSELLTRAARTALWVIAPVLPLMMVFGGILEGPAESAVFPIAMVLMIGGWWVVARSLPRTWENPGLSTT